MASTRSSEGRLSATTRKQLAHVRACEKSGETLKRYAERHGLSVHGLYQAKKIARQTGLLPAHRGRQAKRSIGQSRPESSRFVEGIRSGPAREGAAVWRIRFAGGEVLESSTLLGMEEAAQLIEQLRRRS